MTRSVSHLGDDALFHFLIDPFGNLVILIPGHAGPGGPIIPLFLHEQILVFLEHILPIGQNHRRIVVGQSQQFLLVPHVPEGFQLDGDEILHSPGNMGHGRFVVEQVQIHEVLGILGENLVRIRIDDVVF